MTAAQPHYLDQRHLDRFESLQAQLPLLPGERLVAVAAARWAPYGDGTLGLSSQRLIFLDLPVSEDSALIMIRSLSYGAVQRVDLELDTRDATQPHDIVRIVLRGAGDLGPSEIIVDLPTPADSVYGHLRNARTVSLPIYQHLIMQLVAVDTPAIRLPRGDSRIPGPARKTGSLRPTR